MPTILEALSPFPSSGQFLCELLSYGASELLSGTLPITGDAFSTEYTQNDSQS
jgi:hypothetical protein